MVFFLFDFVLFPCIQILVNPESYIRGSKTNPTKPTTRWPSTDTPFTGLITQRSCLNGTMCASRGTVIRASGSYGSIPKEWAEDSTTW